MKIEAYAILAFVIAIASVLSIGMAFGSSELEKEEKEDEKIHEEWSKENADSDILSYKFVHCPGDDNTYPEGTKCNSEDEEED